MCRPGCSLPPPLTLPYRAGVPARRDARPLDGLKLGLYREWFEDADGDIVSACNDAVSTLESLGATTVPIKIPELDSARVAHTCIISCEMYQTYGALATADPSIWDKLALDIKVSQKSSSMFTASDLLQSQKIRNRTTVFFNRVFEKVDLIVTPTTAISAPRIAPGVGKQGESNLEQLSKIMRFVVTANLTGFPAMSVPVGYDSEGLPIGLQLMGRPWCEATLIDCASKLERALGPPRKPQVALGVLG
mmetsp:Transcript_40084/g.95216  ORF Transcript_40084/g.95216 Transcript_40084/m.95216 type:complete len:248 (+) Transcript_40084:507-1250(+)